MGIAKKLVTNKIRKKVGTPLEAGAAGLALIGAFIIASEFEKNDLEYAYYEVDGAGKVSDNVRLVFLSDLHEKSFGEANEELLEMVRKADPDAVMIGGDMIVSSKKNAFKPRTSTALALCRRLAEEYPVFYGNGNHEQRLTDGSFRKTIEDMGITYLSNETADWKYNISVSGLDLEHDQYLPVAPKDPDEHFIEKRLGAMPQDGRFRIMLSHSPLFIKNYADYGANLILTGHFHGGTIRIAPEVGLMTPQYQFFNTNVVGERHYGASTMIISSGLGTHSINIRINDKPQVVVVDIKK